MTQPRYCSSNVDEGRGRDDARFEALLESAPDSIVGVLSNGRIAFVNREAERAFGYPRAELVGQPVEVLVPERLRDRHRRHREGYLAAPRSRLMGPGLDLYGRRKDGTEFPVEIGLSPVESGDGLLVMAVIRDVTDRREAERKLLRRGQQLKVAQQVAHLGSFEFDVGAGKITWSDELYRLYGLEPGDPRGGSVESFGLILPADQDAVRSAVRQAISDRRPMEVEYRILRPSDGTQRILHTRGELSIDADGSAVMIGTARDVTEEREAGARLAEQRAFLEAVLKQAAGAVVACDRSGKLTFVNEAARALALGDAEGIDLEGVPSLWGTAYGPTGKAVSFEEWPLARALRGEVVTDLELRMVRSDGAGYDLLISGVPVRGADGEILGSVVTAVDITGRKAAERRLRESEERYRRLVEASPDAIAVHCEGRFVYANPAAVELLGAASAAEVLGRDLMSVVHPDSRDIARARIHATQVEGRAADLVEEKLLRFDGEVIDAEIVAIPIVHLGKPASLVVARDVTDRKRAAEALRESQRTISTLMANLPGMVYRRKYQPEWAMEFVSEGCLELTGYRPEELTGGTARLPGDLIHREDREAAWLKIEEAAKENRPFQVVYRIRHACGEERWALSQGQVVSSSVDGSRVIEGFATDITDRQRMLEELAKTRDEALEASRLKSSFLANISHEIRTPLNVILGYNSLIAEHLESHGDETQQGLIEGIERAGKRLIGTVHHVLDYSRIESGGFRIQTSTLEVRPILAPMIEEYSKAAVAKGLRWRWRNEVPDARIRFDPLCLTGAVRNLLDNAVKFTEKGQISVRLHRDPEGALRFEVRDTGVGIAESYRPHLFEPFNQEETGYTRSFEGTGIGLALTRKYLELNGASISVRSEKGSGSTFAIHFTPAHEPPAAESAHGEELARWRQVRTDSSSAIASRPMILVVEDDPQTQTYMKEVLRTRFEVLVAASGRKARRHLSAHPRRIGAILMDLSLKGGEDGLSLTRWLRQQDEWRAVPVIATTAHASPEDRLSALAAGCDDCLVKPFRHQELLELIDRLSG